ncbi:MAG: prolyl oligopeptidase family serine peptidase [Flavobacteriales bacterium]
MPRTRSLILPVFLAFHLVALGQNGQLVERTPYTIPEASIADMGGHSPQLDSNLARTTVQRISYLSDGLKVRGYLIEPTAPGPHPCIIFNRGGNREFGKISDPLLLRFLVPLASWGYVVVASQYRGVDGGEGQEEFGGADVNDVLNLLPVLSQVPTADTSRVGMVGGSRGGLMTYLALTRTTRIKAAVVLAGMADAFRSVAERPEMGANVMAELIPGYATDRDSVLATRSPVRWADRLCPTTPILLLHGTADWRVSPKDALDMADALYAANHPFRLLMFEGGDHGLREYRPEVDRATREFLDAYVRDGKRWPNLEPHGN